MTSTSTFPVHPRLTPKRFFLLLLLVIAAGILDALSDELFADVLKLPLFMDTIFCMALTFYAGPVCGIGAGIAMQVFYAFTWHAGISHIFQLYGICSVCAALTVWLYQKYIINRHPRTPVILFAELLVLSVIMCLVESISGGLINRLIVHFIGAAQETTQQIDFMVLMFRAHISSPLAVAIISRIPINLIDRLICVFAAWGVGRGMSRISGKIGKAESNK